MDWDMYIESDLSNALLRSATAGIGLLGMRRVLLNGQFDKHRAVADLRAFVSAVEFQAWMPRNCYLQMKPRQRWVFTCLSVGLFELFARKMYFTVLGDRTGTVETSIRLLDYCSLYSAVGAFAFWMLLGRRPFGWYGAIFGFTSGLLYVVLVRVSLWQRRRKLAAHGLM